MHALSSTPAVVAKLQTKALEVVLPSSPEMLLDEAEERERECGTLFEQHETLKKITASLQTHVLASPVVVWPETCRQLMRHSWSWLKRSWHSTFRDSANHPSAASRCGVMFSVLNLAKWLLQTDSKPFELLDLRFGSLDEDSGCNALTMLAEYCAVEPPYEPYIAHPAEFRAPGKEGAVPHEAVSKS